MQLVNFEMAHSVDNEYRYTLIRWSSVGRQAHNICTFVMLNPSTATQDLDDPTIRRCKDFAEKWGHDCLIVVNLFALRATNPKELNSAQDPIGEADDAAITWAANAATKIVVAWGTHGKLKGRDKEVLALLRGRTLWCLGTNKNGTPKHPLYLSQATELLKYEVD